VSVFALSSVDYEKKKIKSKWSEWHLVILFISLLLVFAFVGTAVNLQKIGTYASWGDLIKNFDVQVFFLSQPALVSDRFMPRTWQVSDLTRI